LLRRQVGVEIEGLKRQLAVDVGHLAAEIDAEIADALDGVKRNLRVGETVFRIIDTECPADGEGAKAGAFHFKRGAGPGGKLANRRDIDACRSAKPEWLRALDRAFELGIEMGRFEADRCGRLRVIEKC